MQNTLVTLAVRGVFGWPPWATASALVRLKALQRQMTEGRQGKRDLAAFLGSGAGQEFLAQQEIWIARALQRCGGYPGVAEVIDEVRAAGLRQVVFSDYPATAKLEALGLGKAFDAVYVAADWGGLKPDPKVFEALFEAEGVRAEELVHIGDRADTDAGAEEALGYRCLLLGRDIATLSEIPDVLLGESGGV